MKKKISVHGRNLKKHEGFQTAPMQNNHKVATLFAFKL